ncbi:LTA synthase family protein [Enterococcus xiangfangensis]|uniref:LTA synthase family protein n=1 Tax=Enterococcus xiangfangensis TaxID=1296537 RepID=A0ABU3F6R2_9ENTE|nr:LTA synthase family protein [Enterococcus xiangfangensis]MDT2758348.1 LTA synthase family protein [Enterococcus xiangfangensis]
MLIVSILFFILLLKFLKIKPFIFKILVIGLLAVFQISSAMLLTQLLGQALEITDLYKFAMSSVVIRLAVASLTTGVVIFILLLLMQHTLSLNNKQRSAGKISTFISYTLYLILTFLGALSFTSAAWTKNRFGQAGIDEIVYTLSQPLAGADNSQIESFLLGPLLKSIVFSLSVLFATWFFIRILQFFYKKTHGVRDTGSRHRLRSFLKGLLLFTLGLAVLGAGIFSGVQQFGYAEVKAYFFETSELYENYYKDPASVQLEFPQTKRNLIYIYLESMEATYTSKKLGGAEQDNLLPNLTSFASTTGTNFSNTDLIGGAQQVPGVGFTVGGMVAQSAGIPLKVSGGYNANEYGNTTNFMPGAYSIGDILEKEGYNQTLLIGSDANFSGRDKYFTQHGNYDIRDYNYAKKNNWIPEDYHVWWGYEDEKLFEFSKRTLTELASKTEPFNFTMLTADTHFPNGLMTENTPELYSQQYSNVIHFSDQMLGKFLQWVQKQPFYDNTTIVIAGDHLSMDPTYFKDLPNNYTRTVFNLFLNSSIDPKQVKNRTFSTMDLYPSTLAALGVKIDGDRLGLGTNLFSDKQTIPEKLGLKEFSTELSQRSPYYEKNIMQGSDHLNTK